jgi:hypothetical protein
MDKESLIENLSYALKKIFLHDLEGLDRNAMESSIDRFLIERVSEMTAEDILENFYTPERSVRHFIEYLEDSGAIEPVVDQTIH